MATEDRSGKPALLCVTTFWTFLREFSPDNQGKPRLQVCTRSILTVNWLVLLSNAIFDSPFARSLASADPNFHCAPAQERLTAINSRALQVRFRLNMFSKAVVETALRASWSGHVSGMVPAASESTGSLAIEPWND